MNPVASILDHYPALVIDGALANELERRGCDLKDDLWSAKILLEQPEIIKQVHYDYFQAGADCAITASYQASIEGFGKRGLNEKEAVALIQTLVRLAREACTEFWAEAANRAGRPKPFVAASVGPYGAFLADGSEYRGNYGLTENELMDCRRPRMRALVEADPDLLACESIPCLMEAQAIASLLEEFPAVHVWISFTARDEKHISEGQVLADCVKQLEGHAQIAAVGVNCTSPKYITSLPIEHTPKRKTLDLLALPGSKRNEMKKETD